jgi:hypothetical protein
MWIIGIVVFAIVVVTLIGGGDEKKPVTERLAQMIAAGTPVLLDYGKGIYAVRVVALEEKLIGVVDGAGCYASFVLDKVAITEAPESALAEVGLRLSNLANGNLPSTPAAGAEAADDMSPAG